MAMTGITVDSSLKNQSNKEPSTPIVGWRQIPDASVGISECSLQSTWPFQLIDSFFAYFRLTCVPIS